MAPGDVFFGVAALSFLVHLLYVGVGLGRGVLPDWVFVDLVHNVSYVAAPLACVFYANRRGDVRVGGQALGTGLLLWGLANVYWTVVIRDQASPPAVSLAEVLWLSSYPVAYWAVLRLIRGDIGTIRSGWKADSIAAGLAVLAVGLGLVLTPVMGGGGDWSIAVVIAAAYPVGDVVLIALVAGLLTLTGWSDGGGWWRAAAGLLMFAAGDVVYALQIADGSYRSGTLLDASWAGAMLLIAYGTRDLRVPRQPSLSEGWSAFAVPVTASLAAAGVLVAGNFTTIGTPAIAAAVAAIVVVAVRVAQTVRELRVLSESKAEARTDFLTGLPNRRAFYEAMEAEIASSPDASFGVLLIDLDGFKDVNDTLGHLTGDAMLRQVGTRLASTPGPPRFLARLGGDEFAVLLKGASRQTIDADCHWLVAATGDVVAIDGVEVALRLSAGVAVFPDHGGDVESLFSHADVAMYQAKSDRRLWRVYDPHTDLNSRQRLAVVTDLQGALVRDELVVYYQPKISAHDGALAGFEALVRWRHPERGLVQPASFIEIAESTGLITPLTEQVLSTALDQLVVWRNRGLDTRMAVNVAHASLLSGRFVGLVAGGLQRRSLEPNALTLEITETTYLDPVQVRPVLTQLRALGVRISLDDFGTGHASLAHLRDFEVDELKIDRSFVRDLETNLQDLAIVGATLGLARDLGIEVVAEGVESAGTMKVLRDLGCQILQGYVIARPLPAGELGGWGDAGALRPGAASCLSAALRTAESSWAGPVPLCAGGYAGSGAAVGPW